MKHTPDNWCEMSKTERIRYLEGQIQTSNIKLGSLADKYMDPLCDAERDQIKYSMNQIVDDLSDYSEELSGILCNMKPMTLKEVRASMICGDVFTTKEFRKLVRQGYIIDDDGSGNFHDGKREVNVDVFDFNWFGKEECKYPYVCWYNK